MTVSAQLTRRVNRLYDVDMMTMTHESGGKIPARFCVGDFVEVLNACSLPKAEKVIGAGEITRVTEQSTDGTLLYWVAGFPMARTAHVLRLIKRGR